MRNSIVVFLALILGLAFGIPVEGPGKINDLPILDPYQPEKPLDVPILLGERSK